MLLKFSYLKFETVMEYNFYNILKVRPDFTKKELDDAYARICREGDPKLEADFPDNFAFQSFLNLAYKTLADPKRRKIYAREHPDFLSEASRNISRSSIYYDADSDWSSGADSSYGADNTLIRNNRQSRNSSFSSPSYYSENFGFDTRRGNNSSSEFSSEYSSESPYGHSTWMEWKRLRKKQFMAEQKVYEEVDSLYEDSADGLRRHSKDEIYDTTIGERAENAYSNAISTLDNFGYIFAFVNPVLSLMIFISLKGRASYSGLIHLVAAAPFILLCGCLRHSYIYKLSDYLKFLRIASTILAPLLVVALCVALTNPGPKL